MNTIKIDLHGLKHEQVRSYLIEEIEKMWNSGKDVDIITGYSGEMKNIVVEVLNEYQLTYQIGDYFGINNGFIRVMI